MQLAPPDRMLPNLGVLPRDLAPRALVVGDPDRVRLAAGLLGDVREVGRSREYLTVTGAFGGQSLTVVSHGVGAGGANVCFMELLRGGVETFIRAGTCGGLDATLEDGDLIAVTAAIREDAATDHLMPLAYPAVADREILSALLQAAREGSLAVHEGLVVSDANFYATLFPPRWRPYVGHGALGVEMEMAGLLVLAAMHGARAGGILTVDGNLVRDRDSGMSDYDPRRPVVVEGIESMLRIGVQALAALGAAETA